MHLPSSLFIALLASSHPALCQSFTSPSESGSVAGAVAVIGQEAIIIFPGAASTKNQTLPTNQAYSLPTAPNSPIGPISLSPIPGYAALIQHAADISPNQSSILLYGGTVADTNGSTPHSASLYTLANSTLTRVPLTIPPSLPRRLSHSLTTTGDAFMLLGGHNGTGADGPKAPAIVYPDFRLITPANLLGTSLPAPPTGWWQHTASLVGPSLVILGGATQNQSLVPMDVVNIYDTSTQAWSVQRTTGDIPPARRDHAAAVILTSTIVISGGTSSLDGNTLLDDMYSLDTTSWVWSKRTPAGARSIPRRGHVSFPLPGVPAAVGVAMGRTANPDPSDAYVVALMATIWTVATVISGPDSVLDTAPASHPLSPGAIGAIAGSCAAVVLAIGGLLFWQRRRTRKRTILRQQKLEEGWQSDTDISAYSWWRASRAPPVPNAATTSVQPYSPRSPWVGVRALQVEPAPPMPPAHLR